MDNKKERNIFWIGTFFLYLAMMVLTVIPKFIQDYLPYIYVDVNIYRNIATALFTLSLALYFISKNMYKNQLLSLCLCFAYYYIFIKFFIN